MKFPSVLKRRLGPFVRERFEYDQLRRLHPWRSLFLVTHPDDVRHILLSNSGNYTKDPRLTGAAGVKREGAGVLTSSGARHQRLRRQLRPLLEGQVRELFQQAARSQVCSLKESWGGRTRVEITGALRDLALSVLLQALFGPGSEKLSQVKEAIRARRHRTEVLFFSGFPFRERYLSLLCPDAERASSLLTRFILDKIEEVKIGDNSSVVAILTQKLGDAQTVHDELMTFTSAGHETISEAMIWTLLMLARYPEHQERAGLEQDFLDQVLLETLRLYPPSWVHSRYSAQEDTLPSGGEVPRGATVLLCQYILHRHPRFFEDAEKFRPERFGDPSWRARYKFVYFPFGVGLRVCPGEKLARDQCRIVLLEVLKSFRCRPITEEPVLLKAGVTLSPSGPVELQLAPW